MSELLAIPKGRSVKKPEREPDLISKRGKAYYFGPEWVREVGKGYGRYITIRLGIRVIRDLSIA